MTERPTEQQLGNI